MTEADRQIVMLLQLSRQQRREFKAMTVEKKRKVAAKNLRHLGIIDGKGQLTAAFR